MNQAAPLENVATVYCSHSRLQFHSKCGEGAYKQTFRVTDANGTAFALKVHKPGMSSLRTTRELDAMRKCSHPNIARLLKAESFPFHGTTYLVTIEEFLSGGALSDCGNVSVQCGFDIGSQLIDALTHIAAAGLVHRDLKPDNVMFRADGVTAVIVDFGVVRYLTESSITPSWAPRGPGTPYFSSPEQLNNEKHQLDWRSDQFSLGILLADTILREHPFAEPNLAPYQIVDRVATRQQINPRFIEKAKQINFAPLVRMVAPWSIQRFRTPELLREAWQQCRPISRVL